MQKYVILLSLIFLLSGCRADNQLVRITEGNQGIEMDEEIYNGRELNIGVIGKIPTVREQNINFEQTSFTELSKHHSVDYDAVFIMEDYLSEAATSSNIRLYQELKIPFFFVGSKALNIPFIEHNSELSYEDYVQQINDEQTYISGILYVDETEGYKGWTFDYAVKNNQFMHENLEEIYSNVFRVVEDI